VDFLGGDDIISVNHYSEDESDDLTSSDGQSLSSGDTGNPSANYDARTALANRLRQSVVILFIYLAVFVPLIVYISARDVEVDEFEKEFTALSTKVVKSFGVKIANMMSAVDSLSIAATSQALTTNATWPFVTLLDYDLQGASVAGLANTAYVGINHRIQEDERDEWNNYTLREIGWLTAAQARQEAVLAQKTPERQLRQEQRDLRVGLGWFPPPPDFSNGYPGDIFRYQEGSDTGIVTDDSPGPYFPAWQVYPLDPIEINFNWMQLRSDREAINAMFDSKQAVLSEFRTLDEPGFLVSRILYEFYSKLLARKLDDPDATYNGEPVSAMFYPIFDTFNKSRKIVAAVNTIIFWDSFFLGMLPPSAETIVCVVENGCGEVFTIKVNGNGATFLGTENLQDAAAFEGLVQTFSFSELADENQFQFSDAASPLNHDYCPYTLNVYPSDDLHDAYLTRAPFFFALATASAFFLFFLVSMTYDVVVGRRMTRIVKAEKENRAIVSSIFPEDVRKRLLEEKKEQKEVEHLAHPKLKLKSFLDKGRPASAMRDEGEDLSFLTAKPIADLFPFCTVLFADISGFTPWSSEREPEQVFTLLETIFQAFDKLARRRTVFKVETIGDSYVAVTGLPDPQPDHAVRMARFAREGITKFNELTRMLETTLGPDTGELRMRFGLHSGQVTAGVLRGQKSRFQLFGDTVNTAARMESTGTRNRIHISEITATLLIKVGKGSWVSEREDAVHAKGKGILKTFWLTNNKKRSKDNDYNSRHNESSHASSSHGYSFSLNDDYIMADETFDQEQELWGDEKGAFAIPPNSRNAKNTRLVDWLIDVISIDLKRLQAQRKQLAGTRRVAHPAEAIKKGEMVLDEVVEAFTMPKFDNDREALKNRADIDSIELAPAVLEQLRDFVTSMADQYRTNPFHNFEHASHVTMSSVKLLKRIVAPEDVNYKRDSVHAIESDIHKCTFGITSDALAHFSVTFASLIHDVDHRGVPNGQLSKEEPEMGARYKEESVAEQNSVDIAWGRLMDPKYKELQACIFTTDNELKRFRQYVVNLVMATDIFNKRMKELRNLRWEKAFSMSDNSESETVSLVSSSKHGSTGSDEVGTNLKATIVLEHIIQAADVSHTMQHW
jgi:class 3 adenylate cyclase